MARFLGARSIDKGQGASQQQSDERSFYGAKNTKEKD